MSNLRLPAPKSKPTALPKAKPKQELRAFAKTPAAAKRATRVFAEEREAAAILDRIGRGIAIEEVQTARLLQRYGL